MLAAIMQKLTILSVGKVKTSWIQEGCDVYLDRLQHSFDVTERILNAADQKEEEAKIEKILETIKGTVLILEAKGKEYSSEEFAALIEKEKDFGQPLTFIIGGAYGLSEEFKKNKKLLSLGKMTFPHEISKLLLLEQLFRANAILNNTGYHH